MIKVNICAEISRDSLKADRSSDTRIYHNICNEDSIVSFDSIISLMADLNNENK